MVLLPADIGHFSPPLRFRRRRRHAAFVSVIFDIEALMLIFSYDTRHAAQAQARARSAQSSSKEARQREAVAYEQQTRKRAARWRWQSARACGNAKAPRA
jgi:hypothetical protein